VSTVVQVDPVRPDEAVGGLALAAEALGSGSLVVFPTETVYGLAARPDDPDATEAVFRAKRRPKGLNLPILAPSTPDAWEIASPTPGAERLAASFWPGPLTLVLPRTPRSSPWRLGEQRDTVGVRVPDHPLTSVLLERAGPLAATSANVSGALPLSDPSRLVDAFGESVAVYLVLAPGAPRPTERPSTVVDLTRDLPEILRAGPIGPEQLADALSLDLPGWTQSVD
jgi:L-threonylcarbamoyladenylate synthase